MGPVMLKIIRNVVKLKTGIINIVAMASHLHLDISNWSIVFQASGCLERNPNSSLNSIVALSINI